MYSSSFNNPLKVNVTEAGAAPQALIKVSYSIGLEGITYGADGCAPTMLCGGQHEVAIQVFTKGVGLYEFANNLSLDLPPSQSKLVNIGADSKEGMLLLKAALNNCFLWDAKGGKDWLKGALFFTVGNLPTKLNIGNPNPFPIKVSLFLAQQAEGALTLSSGGI